MPHDSEHEHGEIKDSSCKQGSPCRCHLMSGKLLCAVPCNNYLSSDEIFKCLSSFENLESDNSKIVLFH